MNRTLATAASAHDDTGMDADKSALLFGPYDPPALKVGDHALCLYRDCEVRVYGWTVAPIAWPLCYQAGTRARGKGILVEDELARAIRHESLTALCCWWGVSPKTATTWRQAFGIGRMDSEGSRRLIHQAAIGGLNARHKRAWAEVKLWTPEEVALLATLSDGEVSERTGRSVHAVALMRKLVEAGRENSHHLTNYAQHLAGD